MRTFGGELRKIREGLGIKAYQLASKIGVHQTYITYIEKHGKVPSPEVFEEIKKIVGDNPFLNELYKAELESKRSLSTNKTPSSTEKIITAALSTIALTPKTVTAKEIEDLANALSPELKNDKEVMERLESFIRQLNYKYQKLHKDISETTQVLMRYSKRAEKLSKQKS